MSTPIGLATVPLARDRGGPAQPLLTVERLVKHFPVKKGLGGARAVVRAVDGVDFEILKGETSAWSASRVAASPPPPGSSWG